MSATAFQRQRREAAKSAKPSAKKVELTEAELETVIVTAEKKSAKPTAKKAK